VGKACASRHEGISLDDHFGAKIDDVTSAG
jgi:hypothetical protein